MLVNQHTKLPTRKMWAVIVATFVVNGALSVAELFLPGVSTLVPVAEWVDNAEGWIVGIGLIASGYMTRERVS